MIKYKYLSLLFLAIICALIYVYILENYDDFRSISLKNPTLLAPIILLLLIRSESGALITKTILSSLNFRLTHHEAFKITIITTFYNLIMPFKGGALAKAVYLKKIHQFSYLNSITLLTATYITLYFLTSLLGFLALCYIYMTSNNISVLYPLIYFIFTAIFIAILIFQPTIGKGKVLFLNKLSKILASWGNIKHTKGTIVRVSIFTTMQIMSSALILLFLYNAFGFKVHPIESIFIITVINFSLLIQITPSNLGVQEILITLSGVVIGIPANESLSAAILGRTISFCLFFLLGSTYSIGIFKKISHAQKTD